MAHFMCAISRFQWDCPLRIVMAVPLQFFNGRNEKRCKCKEYTPTMLTVQSLYNMYEKGGELSSAILVDLFGILNWSDEIRTDLGEFEKRVQLFDGLYIGLYVLGVPYQEIENARKTNQLDAFIHKKYSCRSSGYYDEFCKNKIIIGKTVYKL